MLPEGWRIAPLASVVQAGRKITYGIVQPGGFVDDGVILVRGGDYSTGWVSVQEMKRVRPEIDAPYRRSKLRAGDLLITIVGANTGTIAIVPQWLEGANITQTTARIAVDEARASASFISHILKSDWGQDEVRKYVKGAAQPGLNLEDVELFRLPLPSLPEQRRIAAVLDAWDAAIASTERLSDALARRKLGIAFALFGDGHNPFAVDGSPLEDIATVAYGKGVAPADYRPDGNVWVIGTQGLMAFSTKAQKHGPVIIVGRKGTLNRPMYVPPGQGFAAIDTTFILRAIDASKSRALFQYLRYIDLAKLNEASGVPSVSADTLRSLPIPQLESRQSDILDACDVQIGLADSAVKSLREQKRGLMQQLLTGKLRVPESIDALLPPAPQLVAAA